MSRVCLLSARCLGDGLPSILWHRSPEHQLRTLHSVRLQIHSNFLMGFLGRPSLRPWQKPLLRMPMSIARRSQSKPKGSLDFESCLARSYLLSPRL